MFEEDAGGAGGTVTGTGSEWEPEASIGGLGIGIKSGPTCDEWYVSDPPPGYVVGDCVPGTTYQIYPVVPELPVPAAMHGADYADARLEIDQDCGVGLHADDAGRV